MASWNIALVSSDEIEPVRTILLLGREAQALASRLISESEQEYQDLRNTDWPAASESARRFRYLRWLRVAVRDFITQQALVSQNLRARTGDLLGEDSDSWSSSDEETDVVITDTAATAA
jgi:hypothetical protein